MPNLKATTQKAYSATTGQTAERAQNCMEVPLGETGLAAARPTTACGMVKGIRMDYAP